MTAQDERARPWPTPSELAKLKEWLAEELGPDAATTRAIICPGDHITPGGNHAKDQA